MNRIEKYFELFGAATSYKDLEAAYQQYKDLTEEDYEICSACGGQCCEHYPGVIFPQELGITCDEELEFVLPLFKKNIIIFDFWDGAFPDYENILANNPYFIRIRTTKDPENKFVNPSWGGQCLLLDNGKCSAEHRPLNCRMLVPQLGKPCLPDCVNVKEICIAEWIPFQEGITKFLEKLKEN